MHNLPLPLTRELVLIGGGHTHALVLRKWGMDPLPGARLTLINPGPTAPYSGMLPGHIAGHYPRQALDIDLVRLARFAGARLIIGAVDGIDREARQVHIAGRGSVAYDIASIDIGITSDLPEIPGFAEHGIAAKPLGPFAERWAAFLSQPAPGPVAVVGGGVAGTELALAMTHALRARGSAAGVTVIERAQALSALAASARTRLLTAARNVGVELTENAEISEITSGAVELSDGREIVADLIVGAAGARPYDWLADTGLDLTDGFITVDPELRSVTDPAIYAAGDCAHLPHAPRPKAGVYAVRAAPVLGHNLRAALSGGVSKPFKPQGDYLKLISLGGKRAIAEKWGLTTEGDAIWRWKDRIDRRFMDRVNTLPHMPAPALPRERATGAEAELSGDQPLCGGCGAKLGAGPLDAALTGLATGGNVMTGPGDDAAVIRSGSAELVLTTDHLRAFCADPHLMARIAAVHALGDVWAMGARPQAALATVILPPMSARLGEGWMREILDAAGAIFAAEGASIAGGHTTFGAELTIGFTVTGVLDDPPVTLAGAQPGDALLLTRPIGSGVLLAAEMAGTAHGDDIAALWDEMARPQSAAAHALKHAHAMTDVTGFGLAGHLMRMLDASGCAAAVALHGIPLYPGAADLAEQGVRSTLFAQNRSYVGDRISGSDGPRTDLLFDPQTSGGLLAAVPGDKSAAVLNDLASTGVKAAKIGDVVAGPARITLS